MRLESLYRVRFTTPEGRCEGLVSGQFRAATSSAARRRRSLPDFRGVVETDDGGTILLAWHGYLRAGGGRPRQLVGSLTHQSDDERYARLNDTVCAVAGEVRPDEVVLEVAELVWEPPETS